MKTFVYSAHAYEKPFLTLAAEGKHELIFSEKKLSVETAVLASGCDAVAIFTSDDASAPVLRKLATFGVKHVALRSAGYDHIDLEKARELGMNTGNVPAYSPYSVAEHAATLLMALNRKVVTAQRRIDLQDFRLDTLVGFDLHGKTVGIVGTGTIGMAFAKIMNGFGTRILAFDPVKNDEAIRLGVQYVSLEELLRQSDVISLHCPLTPATRYLIAKPQLQLMKETAILVNTSRGAIVNTTDLLDALENKKIGGACLDVYENEKPLFFEDHGQNVIKDVLFTRLINNSRVIVTGHQAFLTEEALKGIAETTIMNLDYWEDNEESPHELHPKTTREKVATK